MIDYNKDIICIKEHRYLHSEHFKYHETGNGWTFFSASAWKKNSVDATIGGEGMLIEPRALKSINTIEKIQPRMMASTFNSNPSATIISCYSARNVSEETDLITFYNQLSLLVHSIPKHNVLVIGGEIGKKSKQQIQLTQLVKQKWRTSNRFHTRK